VLILDCHRALQEVPPRYPDHHYGVHGEPAQH